MNRLAWFCGRLKTASFEQCRDVLASSTQFRRGLQQILGVRRIPVAPLRIAQSSDVERLDRAQNVIAKRLRFGPIARPPRAIEQRLNLELRMIVQQERRSQVRLS